MVSPITTQSAQTHALPNEAPVVAKSRAGVAKIGKGKLFINGQFVDAEGGKTRPNVDPSTESVTTTVADASAEDVKKAIHAAREAFDSGPWGSMNPFDRGLILQRVATLMLERAEDFATRETVDVGKPITPTKSFDVPQGAASFAYYGSLAGQLDGATRPGNGASMVYTRREPLGVVGAISPFNFPLNLSINKIAPALAAGNTIVHKPAAETPLSALLLAEVLQDAGLPKGVYNLVTGSGSVAGAEVIANPGVDKIAFTGSTQVGKQTQEIASKTLKHVTLELGGKNALLIFADAVNGPSADLDALVETVFQAGYFNCGQFCMGCSRVIVERSVHDQLVEALSQRIKGAKVGDPFDASTEVGPLAHKAQYDKVLEYVGIAQSEGAKIAVGGNPLRVKETGGKGFFHELTLFTGVRPTMRVAQEEIFGPALSVLTFDTEAEALRIANGLPYGLSAGVATHDLNRAHRVAAGLQAGIVWVNTWGQFTATTSFGGYKQSGYGREIGPEGIEEYLQSKTVYVQMNGLGIRAAYHNRIQKPSGAAMPKTLQDTILPDTFFSNRLSLPGNDTLNADDKFAILDVSFRFEWCFDSQHMDELAAILTDDVILDHFWGYREGKPAVMELLRANVPATRGIRHQSTNAVIVPDGDGSVSVISYLFAVLVANGNGLPAIAGHALVTDVIRKDGDRWKIARRTFEQMRTPEGYLPAETEELWQATAADRGPVLEKSTL
ncbi:Aldehyde dehydrogenase [Acidisarcina polymorpha]|uniref:Aldehyde dehydrogenase n=2 Tax=Acidisarcina polymorpha TaxID=2211140 RepID=A0A2Z5G3U3_9BACT|nr:Aldehyde dehydrogenase [Acidisarcina polymorpha]